MGNFVIFFGLRRINELYLPYAFSCAKSKGSRGIGDADALLSFLPFFMDCWETGWPSESTLNLPFFTDPPPPLQELKIGENKTETICTLEIT